MIGKKIVGVILIAILAVGCANKKLHIDPNDPVQKGKSVFLEQYRFLVTRSETKIGYPNLIEPIPSFEKISTLDELTKFISHFRKIRDINPRTPENEFMDLIDARIQDIKNEIFFGDTDISGTRFENNGGLKGDLAHVYLLHGMPTYKERLLEGNHVSELIAWYYVDSYGKPIFRFLFYKQNGLGSIKLFKSYFPLLRFEDLFEPMTSPLKEISNRFIISPDDLYEVWAELESKDPAWIFRTALLEFSHYSDVVIEGGGNNKIGALDPPEPAALTAARFAPTAFGQPTNLENREFVFSGYHSFIPADFLITRDAITNDPSFSIEVAYSDLDWEIKGDEAEVNLDLRISFQNKKTKSIEEFVTGVIFKGPRQSVDILINQKSKKVIVLDLMLNWADTKKPQITLKQLVNEKLISGDYVINIYLKNSVTKKYNTWREEVIID